MSYDYEDDIEIRCECCTRCGPPVNCDSFLRGGVCEERCGCEDAEENEQ